MSQMVSDPGIHCCDDASALIPAREWERYRQIVEGALAEGVPFALGGGFAFSLYSHRWRNTKDLDLYILPRHRERMIRMVSGTGFHDYHDQLPYDRCWIYRAYQDGVLVDLIWAMANQRAETDERWLTTGRRVHLHGLIVRLLPAEELVWTKLYVVQRDRCDWPDLLNILHAQGPTLDWEHLLERMGDDRRVLGAVVNLFSWMCPARARELPEWLWRRLGITAPEVSDIDCTRNRHRVSLLDTRDWFGPRCPDNEQKEQECRSGR